MEVTALWIAEAYLGVEELEGQLSNPQVLAWLQAEARWVTDDETPWCSAFVGAVARLLRLPRPTGADALRARAWLRSGTLVHLHEAQAGFDVVVLKRGSGVQPGPAVIQAPGHVGFFVAREPGRVKLLGGNQGNAVSYAWFPAERVLGVRRLI